MISNDYTLIAIKPHGVQRGIVGEVIKYFEQKRFLGDLEFMQSPGTASQGVLHGPEGLSALDLPGGYRGLRGASCGTARLDDAWGDQPCGLQA